MIAVLFLDLDGFKQISGRHGHKIGDVVLRTVADRLRTEVRLADTVARWAGDEFAIVIEDASRKRSRSASARVARPIEISALTGTSVGVAFYPVEAVTAHELWSADQRIFDDKARRRKAESFPGRPGATGHAQAPQVQYASF